MRLGSASKRGRQRANKHVRPVPLFRGGGVVSGAITWDRWLAIRALLEDVIDEIVSEISEMLHEDRSRQKECPG